MRKIIMVLVLLMATVVAGFSFPSIDDYDTYSDFTWNNSLTSADTERVLEVLDVLSRRVYDMGNNREVECFDYTMLFLIIWKNKYGTADIDYVEVDKPEGVCIGFPDRWYHCFIRIRSGGVWCYIEPQVASWKRAKWREYMYERNFWRDEGYCQKKVYGYVRWNRRKHWCERFGWDLGY